MAFETVALALTLDAAGHASAGFSPAVASVARVEEVFVTRTGGPAGSVIVTLTDNVGDSPFLYQNQFSPPVRVEPKRAGVAPFTLDFANGPVGATYYVLIVLES